MTYWQWLLAFFAAQLVWSFLTGFSRILAGFRRCSLCRVWRQGTTSVILGAVFKSTRAEVDWVVCPYCMRHQFAESMRSLAEGLIKATDAVEPKETGGVAS